MAFSVNCRALPVFVRDLAFSPSVTVTSPIISVLTWGWNALKPTLKVSFLFLPPWGRISTDALSGFSIFLSGMSSVGFSSLGSGLLLFLSKNFEGKSNLELRPVNMVFLSSSRLISLGVFRLVFVGLKRLSFAKSKLWCSFRDIWFSLRCINDSGNFKALGVSLLTALPKFP